MGGLRDIQPKRWAAASPGDRVSRGVSALIIFVFSALCWAVLILIFRALL